LLLWFTIVPEAVGLPPPGSAWHDVIFTSSFADFDDVQLAPAHNATPATSNAPIR
jgi:hypothetical protein